MYRLRIRYEISDKGQTWADIICEEADEGFSRCLFSGWNSPEYGVGAAWDWQELQERVDAALAKARAEIARRRALIAERPVEIILEI